MSFRYDDLYTHYNEISTSQTTIGVINSTNNSSINGISYIGQLFNNTPCIQTLVTASTDFVVNNYTLDENQSGTVTSQAQDTAYHLEVIQHINYFLVPFLLLVGITGNICTILVMRSKRFRGMVVSEILVALATSDAVVNVLLPHNRLFVRRILGVDIRSLNEVTCKMFFWAFRVSKITSSWLVVCIASERYSMDGSVFYLWNIYY